MNKRLAALLLAGSISLPALAAGTVFWIEPRSNVIIDQQVSAEVAARGSLAVLRASRGAAAPQYEFPALVQRLKQNSRSLPVLGYAWATRRPAGGRIEADLLRNLDTGVPLAEIDDQNSGSVKFLDVTSPEVRRRIVAQLTKGKAELGVDGLALDLSTRTPVARPPQLAKVCRLEYGFCPRYAEGMDDLFAELKRGMGPGSLLAFNGLFNFTEGQLDDQARLLAQSDMAAIEYFGMDPNRSGHDFTRDIQPYLQVLARLPADKAALVFGRGPWHYTDYVSDYQWQRYLYASFLLAARDKDLFKYHASFQAPAHKGRSGALDYYADWNIKLGAALGAAKFRGGLYQREFSNGLVVVAPDDRGGGQFETAGAYTTPEGERFSGRAELQPGQALILLSRKEHAQQRPVSRVISGQQLARWGWTAAEATSNGVRLGAVTGPMIGEHDLLLDFERSLTPYQQLSISASLPDTESAILAVMEVDDPRREYAWLVVQIDAANASGTVKLQEAVEFRAPPRKREPPQWPYLYAGNPADREGRLVLDGASLATKAGYRFRRWSHLRFQGAVTVSEAALSAPVPLRP